MRRAAVLLPVLAACASALAVPQDAHAALAWWQPLGLQDTAVTAVRASGSAIAAETSAGTTFVSVDAGRNFRSVAAGSVSPPGGPVQSGRDQWAIDGAGRVVHAAGRGAFQPDAQSPALGPGARLLAAPAAYPGVVVAVSAAGVVWRRAQDGTWAAALLLLPAGFPQGVPRVTDVAAFDRPVTGAVYLSTDGYAVLVSTDGGDDWIRGGPGLPNAVYALAADSSTQSLYAATSDGVWVHRLQALPAPPVYRDAALAWRWVGTLGVAVVAAVMAALLLVRIGPRRTPA